MAGGPITPIPTPSAERLATGLGIFSLLLGTAELLLPTRTARLTGLKDRPLLLRAYGVREIGAGIGLLGAEDPAPWLWFRVAGDAVDLATLLTLARSGRGGSIAASVAAVLGVTALDAAAALLAKRPREADGSTIRRAITIDRPVEELRALLERPDTITRLAGAGAHANPEPDGSSHWIIQGPGRRSAMWTMGRAEHVPEGLRWSVRRDDGAPLRTLTATFANATRGTVATLELQLARTPAGRLASPLLASTLARTLIDTALHRFKSLAETGEIPTTEGQPAAHENTR